MKQRGKSWKTEQDNTNTNICSDFNYFASSSSSNMLCKKHPSNPSLVGVCAYCLNEKLISLVCSDCGEQRISSCSCSDVSSYRNSSCNFDVGSVGRISFLIENEKGDQKTIFSHMKAKKQSETGDVVMLKRSNSCVVDAKKSIGFWKIGKLFKKKREKDCFSERNRDGLEFDEKSDMDVSGSRSLSSFMDGNFESAKVSDFNEVEPRKSGFAGGLMDFDDDGDDANDDDDDEFIDLEIDLCDKLKTEHSVFKKDDSMELISGCGMGSSSCRFSVSDRGIKKVKNSRVKAWKWIFKHHSGKKDVDHILES